MNIGWMAIVRDAGAATLAVGPGQTYPSIGEALSEASDGDRIEVEPDTYEEPLLEIDVDVEIVATGGSATTTWIAKGELGARVVAGADVTITGFTAVPSDGGSMVWVQGSLTAEDWVVSGASESPLLVQDGSLVLVDSVLDGNTGSAFGGHVVVFGGTLTVRDSELRGGEAPDGGAIYVEGGELVLERATFESNQADGQGGAVYVADGVLTALDTVWSGNLAASDFGDATGGGVWVGGSTTFSVEGCSFDGNRSDVEGGGFSAEDSAGGVFVGAVFTGNSAAYGGALYIDGDADLTVVGSTFDDNHATAGNGGALRVYATGAPAITIDTSTFTANTATGFGGALAATTQNGALLGELVLESTWFSNNTADNGGALSISNIDTIDAAHVVLCANEADNDGGGARVSNAGFSGHQWTNTLFSDNRAGGSGGGMRLDGAGPTDILNDAFLGNDAAFIAGGGLSITGTDVSVANTLVAWTDGGGGVGDDLLDFDLSVDYSAFYDNADGDLPLLVGGTGNLFDDDPQLASYSADGDCTNDQVWPRAGSPLIDAGDPGYTDPDGTRSDIGVYGGPQADWSEFVDADADGWTGAADCDDGDAGVNPDAPETCNGVDDDCDGQVDADPLDAVTFHEDGDGDGFGSDSSVVTGCVAPDGFVAEGGDCDDASSVVSPAGVEVCNAIDDDCDGEIDDGVASTWWADGDGDGYGSGVGVVSCDPVDGSATADGDCDDADRQVNPGVDDTPGDGLDANCDGVDGLAADEIKDEELLAGGGCACDQAPGGAGWLALAALALGWRARRSQQRVRHPLL
ncbi:MAG: MopE-related protein [Myxococcota bacterium]